VDQGADRELDEAGAIAGAEAPAEEDPRSLHGRAVAVVSRAIDDGDVDVALRVLALGDPRAARRRRWWTAGALAVVAALSLLAGVLVGGALNGGSVGEDAPEPLAFGDSVPLAEGAAAVDPAAGAAIDPTAADPAAVDPAAIDPAATDPAAIDPAATVLGTSVTAPPAASSGPFGATTPAASGSAGLRTTTPPTTARPGTAAAPSPSAAPAAPVTAAPTTAAPRVGALDGSWVAGASQAGYRISKTWTLGGNTEEVVGRTNRVGGALSIAGDRLTAANVLVDMGSVDSGNLIRDAAFREQLLLTGGNPEARFDLSAPIDIAGRPAAGQVFATRATGKLRVRGVVRDVVAELQARQNGASIQVIGTIGVKLTDFGVPNPSFALATVSDRATVEFSVTFNRA